MKRLSTKFKLISSSKIITSSTLIPGTQFANCSSSSISRSPIQNLIPYSHSNGLFYKPYKTHEFYGIPSQNYRSHGFDEGEACLNTALELSKEGEDPHKILFFANKALALLDNVEKTKCCLPVAMTLQLLGSINCSLRKFSDALGFLNRANKILIKLEDDGKFEDDIRSIKIVLLAVQINLADVHLVMGRSEESMDYLRKSLEIKGFLMGNDSREFGDANRAFAGVCVGRQNFKDGLSYCLKAVEIHLRLFGENSLEVARDRRLLGVIYSGLEEYEKAAEENLLAQKAFTICGCSEDVIRVAIDDANMLIARGRYEAAMETLKEHEMGVEENSENPLVLMTMGKALTHLEKFADAKGCLKIACMVLDKKEKSMLLEVADAYIKVAGQYGTMNDVDRAISLLLRAPTLLQNLLEEKHLEGSVLTKIECLLTLTDKVTEGVAIPYLGRAVESVKEGSKHFGIGYVYYKLGRAYLKLERRESAENMFAKIFLDFSLSPHHNESIHTFRNLSNAYADKNRWIKCETTTKIVESFKSAILSERYTVFPTLASLVYSQPIYHLDSNFLNYPKDKTFQIGIAARSEEGNVLWAKILVVDMDKLMPSSLAMKGVDINMAEIAGFGYITIHAHEHGISDFLLVTDSKLSRDYLNSIKNNHSNKSHRFLVVLCKQLWFYSQMTGRRVIWVDNYKNEVANALSRTRCPSDKWMPIFYQVVEDELPNFMEKIEIEKKENGREVEKGGNFEDILKENMKKLD